MIGGHDIAMALRAAYWAMHREADALLQPHGVTANQFVLMSILAEDKAVSPSRNSCAEPAPMPTRFGPCSCCLSAAVLCSVGPIRPMAELVAWHHQQGAKNVQRTLEKEPGFSQSIVGGRWPGFGTCLLRAASIFGEHGHG